MGARFSLYDQRTFKQIKKINAGSKKRLELANFLQSTISQGNIREAVKLPKKEDLNEWLAVNIIDFYNQVSVIYGHVQDHCTQKTCSKMSAGPKYEWFWADGKNIKDPIGVSAPEYVDYLMEWCAEQFEDHTLFPPTDDKPFPNDFQPRIKPLFKRLFRVYAHVYWHHIELIKRADAEEDLNSGFKHFYLFVKEFDLVQSRDMIPLEHLTKKIDEKTRQREREARLNKSAKKKSLIGGEKGKFEDEEVEVEEKKKKDSEDEVQSKTTSFYDEEGNNPPKNAEEKKKRRHTKVEYE